MTDLLAYARFHMGDGTAANGERVLKRESLEQMRTAQMRKQANDDDMGLGWHLRQVGPIRTYRTRRNVRRPHPAARDRARAQLRHRHPDEREHGLAPDPGRRARGLKSYLGATYATNQAIAHRGLVETLPSVQPLAQQPDPAPYVGTYARPNNSFVVRVEGGKMSVQDRPNDGSRPEMPVAFYGPDRVVVTDGPDRGQSIEFVRDESGRVGWIRVVGRAGVRVRCPLVR